MDENFRANSVRVSHCWRAGLAGQTTLFKLGKVINCKTMVNIFCMIIFFFMTTQKTTTKQTHGERKEGRKEGRNERKKERKTKKERERKDRF